MKLCFPVLCIFVTFVVLSCPAVNAIGGRGYNRRTKVMRGFDGIDNRGRLPTVPERFELNHACRSSFDCLAHIPNSQCDYVSRVCVCQKYHVIYNNTICLPASLLGYPCIMDAQCQVKVRNSLCVDGLCGCDVQHVPLRKDKCLPPVKVGEICLHDLQCRYHSPHSYCSYKITRVYGRCNCPEGYHVSDDGYCLPHLGQYCETHEECDALTPNSYCAFDQHGTRCECLEGFVPSDDYMKCEFDIPEDYNSSFAVFMNPISLGKSCNSTEECQTRDPYTHCLNGICDCIVPDDTCNAQNTGCHNDTFQCREGNCISWFFVCDGIQNCPDNSDEDECVRYNCPRQAFQCDDGTCIPRKYVCNGHWQCPDGSDEARCYTGIACDKDAFRCRNGQCLPSFVFCNALRDCADGSDEIPEVCQLGVNCSSVYRNTHHCLTGRCRSTAVACSGRDGCGDASDEERCEVCYCKKP